MKDYLLRFSNAVADCPTLSSEDKLRYFLERLDTELRRFVYVCRPGTMSEAIKLVTDFWEDVESNRKDKGEASGWKKGEHKRPTCLNNEPQGRIGGREWLRAPDPGPRYGVV